MKKIQAALTVFFVLLTTSTSGYVQAQNATKTRRAPIEAFIALLDDHPSRRTAALEAINYQWNVGDTGLLLESARFAKDSRTRAAIFSLLRKKTGRSFRDVDAWYRWIWNQTAELHPQYGTFKQKLYQQIDPQFAEYFSSDYDAEIRLDEIRWGGVERDGIPPLKNPETISAPEATFP